MREVSLGDLLRGQMRPVDDPCPQLTDIVNASVRAGWPRNVGLAVERATWAVRDHLDQVRRTDISRVERLRSRPCAPR